MHMRSLFILAALSALTACKGTPPSAHRADAVGAAAVRVGPAPTLARTAPSIDNLDRVPADASARIESTVLAIVENRTIDFVDTLSLGGFSVGALALTKEQAAAELEGRSVAELTNVACADACEWSVSPHGANELQLEARVHGALVGAVTLAHEDDGSWGVAGAITL